MLDVARRFLLLEVDPRQRTTRREVSIEALDPVTRVQQIAALRAQVLICGAVSRPLESMLVSAGVRVIPNTCGEVDEVVAAFLAGRLTDGAFLMPGCTGRRRGHRRRHRGGRR